jgi:hypothetical protein
MGIYLTYVPPYCPSNGLPQYIHYWRDSRAKTLPEYNVQMCALSCPLWGYLNNGPSARNYNPIIQLLHMPLKAGNSPSTSADNSLPPKSNHMAALQLTPNSPLFMPLSRGSSRIVAARASTIALEATQQWDVSNCLNQCLQVVVSTKSSIREGKKQVCFLTA